MYGDTLKGDQLILNVTVSGLMEELFLRVLSHVLLQLNGAPYHHTSAVRLWLNSDSPNIWISLQGPVEFHYKSPDLMRVKFLYCVRIRSSL